MVNRLIRQAAEADLPTLLEIDQACFPPEIAYDSAELAWFLNRRGAEGIVLEEDGEIAAFLILEIRTRRKTATMVTLDVRPGFRQRGYAARLVERSEEILAGHGVTHYELQVDIHNASAIRFYLKHGFRAMRTLKGYYANGNDAYLMAKTLRQTAGA